jgi:hypothetical protein
MIHGEMCLHLFNTGFLVEQHGSENMKKSNFSSFKQDLKLNLSNSWAENHQDFLSVYWLTE